MRIEHIVNEDTVMQQFNELVYNLRHRASPDTIQKMSAVLNLADEDTEQKAPTTVNNPTATPVAANKIPVDETSDATITQQVTEMIKKLWRLATGNAKDKAEFQKQRTFGNREILRDVVDRTLKSKRLPLDLGMNVSNWFIECSGTYEERMQFLEDLSISGYLETSALTSPGFNNFDSIVKYRSVVYDTVKQHFMNYEGKISGVSIGKGELYCVFFASDVFKGARGDLIIRGKEAEVKSVKARFLATTGYGSTLAFFETYKGMLRELVPNVSLSNDRNDYNWNYKGLHTLSDLFKRSGKPNECKKIIDRTLEALYVESTPEQRSRVSDVISNDGSFDVSSFLHAWVLMQFEYYKSIDGFDGILFLNPANYNFVYIEDSLQLDDSWDLFRIHPSLSWKESRNVTSQISLL